MPASAGDPLCNIIFWTAAVSSEFCRGCVVPLRVMGTFPCYASIKTLLCPESCTCYRWRSLLGFNENLLKGFTESLSGSVLARRLSQTALPHWRNLMGCLFNIMLKFVLSVILSAWIGRHLSPACFIIYSRESDPMLEAVMNNSFAWNLDKKRGPWPIQ